MKNDHGRHASGSILAVAMTFVVLSGAPLPIGNGKPGGVTATPVACDGGSLKRMTGGVGSVTCYSTLEMPRPEGGEAKDPAPAAHGAPAPEPELPADPAPQDPPADELF